MYDFRYDASIALVLALSDAVLDVCPLSVTALRNQALLNRGLGLNLLNELSDDFIDGVLVVLVGEDVEHGTSLNLCEAIISKRGLIILIEVDDELVFLTVEFFLKFLGEGLELVRNALEGFLLLGAHLGIDVVDGGDECAVGRVDGLLHAQLNVHQVTFECLNQLEKLALVNVIFDGPAIVLHLESLLVDLTEDVLLCLLVHLNLADRLDLGVTLSFAHLFLAEGKNLLLFLLLVFDVVLELADGVLDIGLGVLDNLGELKEAGNLVIVIKGLHTVIEEVQSVVDVSFLKSLKRLL